MQSGRSPQGNCCASGEIIVKRLGWLRGVIFILRHCGRNDADAGIVWKLEIFRLGRQIDTVFEDVTIFIGFVRAVALAAIGATAVICVNATFKENLTHGYYIDPQTILPYIGMVVVSFVFFVLGRSSRAR